MLSPFNFLWRADLSIPINLAILDTFPPNFLSWIVKYSFSKCSLASFSGTDSDEKTSTIIKESLKEHSTDTSSSEKSLSVPLKEAREHFEKEYLTIQLKKFGGNVSKMAKFIGMERSALHRKLKGLNIKDLN